MTDGTALPIPLGDLRRAGHRRGTLLGIYLITMDPGAVSQRLPARADERRGAAAGILGGCGHPRRLRPTWCSAIRAAAILSPASRALPWPRSGGSTARSAPRVRCMCWCWSGGAAALGAALHRVGRSVALAACLWAVVGGRSPAREAERIGGLAAAGDLTSARERLPTLVGRDPAELDASCVASPRSAHVPFVGPATRFGGDLAAAVHHAVLAGALTELDQGVPTTIG